MGNFCQDFNFAIGDSPAYLITLKNLQIPVPDQVVYRPYAALRVRADYSRVGDGFITADWIWDIIARASLFKLLEFLDGAEYNDVYIRTDKRTGQYPNPRPAFAVFSARMWKPSLTGNEGSPIARSPYAYQTVKVSFVNLVEQVDYI